MYIPKHFLCSDVATLMELWRLNPLIDLVTVREGKPHVSPLPVLIEHRNDHVIIRGHWARANPQWQHPSNATAIFHGPNHYISPS